MSSPYLISTDNLAPLVPTRKLLHDLACESGEKAFRDGIDVPPTWFIATGTRIVVIATPWDDTREKRAAQRLIRILLEVVGAQAYAFISETWTAMVTDPDPAKAKAKMDWINEHGVVALSRDEREEILLVASSGRKAQDCAMSRYVINSGGKKPWLGIRVDEEEAGEHTGPMFGLFQQPMPDDRVMDIARRMLGKMQASFAMN